MSVTTAEIESIVRSVRRASRTGSAVELRRMMTALTELEFSAAKQTPLRKLCAAGVEYGWNQLTKGAGSGALAQTTPKAQASLRRHLQWTLEWITRPSLELEWTSFVLALNSLGLSPGSDRRTNEGMFWRDRPSHRLFYLFKRFPVLAHLWSLAIRQWRGHVVEILNCSATDRSAIARSLFRKSPPGQIKDVRLGLSDPHDGGRSVALIEFDCGRIIYKPRAGTSESAWFELLTWMNRNGFRPKLRAARVLRRKNYSWMEYIEAAACRNQAAVRRFYTRLGGMIAAAYVVKAVDCHRENVIAAGEYPVLVDVDALWHVSAVTKLQRPADVLHRTGLFPNSKRRSLQSRSSVLGWTRTGKHLARIDARPVVASDYAEEIIRGFSRGWDCLVGTSARHGAFRKRLRRILARPRRWVYFAP